MATLRISEENGMFIRNTNELELPESKSLRMSIESIKKDKNFLSNQ